jgi:hypothetical protein
VEETANEGRIKSEEERKYPVVILLPCQTISTPSHYTMEYLRVNKWMINNETITTMRKKFIYN